MNKIRLAATLLGTLALSACGDADEHAADEAAKPVLAEATPQKDETKSAPSPASRRELDEFDVETLKVVYRHEGTETGTTTLWVEDYGDRVAMETDLVTRVGKFEQPRRQRVYWDGSRTYSHDMAEDSLWDTGMRMKDMEPSAFGITSDKDLERVGYERLGVKTIAGKTCEHWRNEALAFEACRWKRVDLLSINRAMSNVTGGIQLAKEAVELVEGEGIPAEFKRLAK